MFFSIKQINRFQDIYVCYCIMQRYAKTKAIAKQLAKME